MTLTVSLDMDPCVDVKIVTKEDLTDNQSKSLFDENQQYKEIKMPKNYRYASSDKEYVEHPVNLFPRKKLAQN